ncbi:MAG: hypothetical protein JWM68_4748 [Verrucomicrobiales bacterium]|nr:hypothetical protein [Verrucomicrobiales bacterium]
MKTFALVSFFTLAAVSMQADCSLTGLGVLPLNELTAPYKGAPGGLYGTNQNNRPLAHLNSGLQIATNQVRPLNAAGQQDSNNGKIVMISIGMSHTTHEWAIGDTITDDYTRAFRYRATNDPSLNRKIVIVDGAQSGHDTKFWTNLNDPTWTVALDRITNAGVTTNQVQIAWIKQALANELSYGAFPAHAQHLQNDLEIISRNLKIKFPNIKMAFVSSRTRAYTDDPNTLNPEPGAYETGFAVKWMMQKQISGDTSLKFGGTNPKAPYLSWGPYTWVDGLNMRSDGALWNCDDLRQNDYTHPSSNGVYKVASQLLAFFKTDPTTTPWYLRRNVVGQAPTCTISGPAVVTAGQTGLFTVNASDPDGQIQEVVWNFDDGDCAYSTNVFSWVKLFRVRGTYTIRATVTDNSGNTAIGSLNVTVQ